MDARSCLTNRHIHFQTWVKEVSDNDVFSMFLSESLAEALDVNITLPLSFDQPLQLGCPASLGCINKA